jgi:hypothetical protein
MCVGDGLLFVYIVLPRLQRIHLKKIIKSIHYVRQPWDKVRTLDLTEPQECLKNLLGSQDTPLILADCLEYLK